MMIFRPFLCFVLILCMPFGAVFAEEQAGEEQRSDEFMSVWERVEDFTKDFDELSKTHFHAVYGNHNMIRTVDEVREQVSDAVEKCGEANPGMKQALVERFGQWEDAIQPVMDDALANVDNMIIAQEYAKPRDFKKLLKFVDKVRVKQKKQIEKYPVTTPEACEYLRNKMDETEQNLIGLLEATLISLPQALINDVADEKAKQEEEEASAEEDVQPEGEDTQDEVSAESEEQDSE